MEPFVFKIFSVILLTVSNAFIVKQQSIADSPSFLENDSTDYITPTGESATLPSTTEQNNDTDCEGDYDDYYCNSTDSWEDFTHHQHWPLVYHEENCGRSKLQLARKSIGGHSADIGEYPWMARLVYRSFRKGFEKSGCGGSLINNFYVITAAHCCFTDKDAYLSYVRLGEYDVHLTRDCFRGNCAPHTLDVEVSYFTKHPLHDKESFSNDICLIRLRNSVEFTDYIQPICLPSTFETDEERLYGINMTVIGWGATDFYPQKRFPHVLQEVDVVVRPTEVCEEFLEQVVDWEVEICAGGVAPAQDPCPGDSGGPLMYYNTTGDSGRHVLMGVVSAGDPCSHSDPIPEPAIFARVSNLMPWILHNIYSGRYY